MFPVDFLCLLITVMLYFTHLSSANRPSVRGNRRFLRWPAASWAKTNHPRISVSGQVQVILCAYKEAFKRLQDRHWGPTILKWTQRTASTLSLENLVLSLISRCLRELPRPDPGSLSCRDWLLWWLQVGNVLQVIREVLPIWVQS